MKRITVVLAVFLAVASAAAAEGPDLSGLTFDELAALDRQCQMEMITRPEWVQVRVPGGFWVVGEDIPAGKYSFRLEGKFAGRISVWGAKARDYAAGGGLLVNLAVYSADEVIGKIELKDGNVLELSCAFLLGPAQTLGF